MEPAQDTTEIESSSVVDLTPSPASNTDPLAHIRELLKRGFCEREIQGTGKEHVLATEVDSTYEPIVNLRKALQHGFCVPGETAGDADCVSSMTTRSCDLGEGSKSTGASKEQKSNVEDREEGEEELCYVVVTELEPGYRTERIARALEVFLFAVLFLYTTFYILWRLDLDVRVSLHRKQEADMTSLF